MRDNLRTLNRAASAILILLPIIVGLQIGAMSGIVAGLVTTVFFFAISLIFYIFAIKE